MNNAVLTLLSAKYDAHPINMVQFAQFQRNVGERGEDADLWLAYCAFHLGDYKRAMEVSKPLLNSVTLVWMCESIFLFL